MLPENSDQIQKPLRVAMQEDKYFSTAGRLVSKESSVANPSFRVYYGVASGSVPFLWESRPGTPKNAISDTSLPPLTPPPSYYNTNKSRSFSKKSSKSSFIHTFFPKLRRSTTAPSLSSLSVSSSTSSSTNNSSHRRTRFAAMSPRSSFSSSRCEDEELEEEDCSPTSTLCFGMRHGTPGRVHGLWSVIGG